MYFFFTFWGVSANCKCCQCLGSEVESCCLFSIWYMSKTGSNREAPMWQGRATGPGRPAAMVTARWTWGKDLPVSWLNFPNFLFVFKRVLWTCWVKQSLGEPRKPWVMPAPVPTTAHPQPLPPQSDFLSASSQKAHPWWQGVATQGAEPAVLWTTQPSLSQATLVLLLPSVSGFLLVQSH